MSNHEFKIVVLGGGSIGASIFFELIRRGLRQVALIDRGRLATSATANSAGMLRVFHENPIHVDLALEHRLSQTQLIKEGVLSEVPEMNGALYFFSAERLKQYSGLLERMDRARYPFELLTSRQGSDRFPLFKWNSSECALYEPSGGSVDPRRFGQDLIDYAVGMGGTLFDGTEVRRICRYLDRYRVSTELGTFTTQSLVLAGGAAMLPRLRDLGLDFQLSSRTLNAVIAPRKRSGAVLPNFFDRETLVFGRLGGRDEVVLSDPLPNRLETAQWEQSSRKVSAHDCYAPDRIGLMGKAPGHPRLFIATGWGGTAFKFSLAVGAKIANLLERECLGGELSYGCV